MPRTATGRSSFALNRGLYYGSHRLIVDRFFQGYAPQLGIGMRLRKKRWFFLVMAMTTITTSMQEQQPRYDIGR